MFSHVATKTLAQAASRRATVAVARNGLKLSSPGRALSDVAASAPKQPVDIPAAAAKQWGPDGYRRCNGGGRRVVGKAAAFGLVGYGGYLYGANSVSGKQGRCTGGSSVTSDALKIEAKTSAESSVAPLASGANQK